MVSYINEWIVREYSELVKDQDGVVLLGVEALTVEEAQTLRNDVRESGAQLVLGKKPKNAKIKVCFGRPNLEELVIGLVDNTHLMARPCPRSSWTRRVRRRPRSMTRARPRASVTPSSAG